MKKYVAYRETASPFLAKVPTHWQDKKIGRVYAIKSIGNNTNEQLLSVFLDRGVVSYADTNMKQVHKPSEDMSAYQLVEPDDFVLNNQQAWRGSVGISAHRGIVSPAYIVMIPIEDNNPRFMNYAVRQTACVAQYVLSSKGVGSIQRILSPIKLKSCIIVLPPRTEQDQIVRYLDWQVSKINRLIAAKKKEISLCNEQSLCALNHLLTKGIVATSYTESGIDWVGEMPSTWKVSKIGRHFRIAKRIAGSEGYDVYSVTQQGLKVRDIKLFEGQLASDYSGYQFVYPGEFAMNHMDLLTGGVGLADHLGVTSPDYRVVQLFDTEKCYKAYYLRIFQLCYRRHCFYRFGHGAANVGRWRLPSDAFSRFEIPLPPYSEQVAIAEKIDAVEAMTNKRIAALDHEIELLKELRTRLISDVVTGQIDVRDIKVPEFEYTPDADSSDADEEENQEEEPEED